jgi:hypothetical protein
MFFWCCLNSYSANAFVIGQCSIVLKKSAFQHGRASICNFFVLAYRFISIMTPFIFIIHSQIINNRIHTTN